MGPITVEQIWECIGRGERPPCSIVGQKPYLHMFDGGTVIVTTKEGKAYHGTDLAEAVAAYNAALPKPTEAEHIVEFVEVADGAEPAGDYGKVEVEPPRLQLEIEDITLGCDIPIIAKDGRFVGKISGVDSFPCVDESDFDKHQADIESIAHYIVAAVNACSAAGLTTDQLTDPRLIKAISDFLSARDDGEPDALFNCKEFPQAVGS